jgi:transcriptional regulator GlxA family with amidase domain
MSERTFARRFAAETGTTPGKWLLGQRLHHARTLLESSDLPVETVAARAGFGSAALLRHHFSAQVGVAPGEYRRTFRTPDVRAG